VKPDHRGEADWFWGGLAASSLILGTALGLVRRWPRQLIGLVLAFGAGAAPATPTPGPPTATDKPVPAVIPWRLAVARNPDVRAGNRLGS
jgi:hypothetical protein